MKKIQCWAWALCLGLTLAISPAFAGDLIVFQAKGLTLQPGQSIDGSKSLHLTAGQAVTLIAENGRVFQLKGPFDQAPMGKSGKQANGVVDALKSLMVSSSMDSGDLGVTRDSTAVIQSAIAHGWLPEPWVVDVTRSGDYCLQEGIQAIFWRPDVNQEAKIRVEVGKNKWRAHAFWPAGAAKLTTPEVMPIMDGESYKIEMNGQIGRASCRERV